MSTLGDDLSSGLGGSLGLALAQLANKPRVTNIWYDKKKVKLDGYHFVECRFDGCELHLERSNFILERCLIDPTTVIYYGGDLTKPIRLFNARFEWMYTHMPHFTPERDANGRITIR